VDEYEEALLNHLGQQGEEHPEGTDFDAGMGGGKQDHDDEKNAAEVPPPIITIYGHITLDSTPFIGTSWRHGG
jgi:hypothetical protein